MEFIDEPNGTTIHDRKRSIDGNNDSEVKPNTTKNIRLLPSALARLFHSLTRQSAKAKFWKHFDNKIIPIMIFHEKRNNHFCKSRTRNFWTTISSRNFS